MKGISPIVAAVLLIAITMTIAGILAYWSATYVKKSLPEEGDAQCKFADFDFDACSYNSSSKTAVFILNNKKNIELKNLTVFVRYPNNTVSTILLNDSLPASMLKSFNISFISSDFSNLLVKTHCAEATATSSCTRS